MLGHDGVNLSIGQWVAIAYDEAFFIGKVTDINIYLLDSEEEVTVNFLTKTKDGSGAYKWPKRKDTASVSMKYIFCSIPVVQRVGSNPNTENDVLFSNDTGILGKRNSEFSQQESNQQPPDY